MGEILMHSFLISVAAIASVITLLNPPSSSDDVMQGPVYSRIALNFDSFKNGYENHYGKKWVYGTPKDSKPFVDAEGHDIGEVVLFSDGFLACKYDYSLVVEPVTGRPFGWDSTNNYYLINGEVTENCDGKLRSIFDGSIIDFSSDSFSASSSIGEGFRRIDDIKKSAYKNFSITSVLCDFSVFSKEFGYRFADFEKWNTYCIKQKENMICMTCAVTDLILTFKYSTKHDATNGLSPYDLYDAIDAGMVKGPSGNSETTFVIDVNKFLDKTGTGIYLNSGTAPIGTPFIANYHRHLNVLEGHTALVIGSAQNDYWWIFKTYWDIVVTWYQNFDSKTLTLNKGDKSSIFFIDHQYQTGGYFLCKDYVGLTLYN